MQELQLFFFNFLLTFRSAIHAELLQNSEFSNESVIKNSEFGRITASSEFQNNTEFLSPSSIITRRTSF